MADETLKVKIQVETDTSQVNQLNSALGTTSNSSKAATNAVNSMKNAISGIRVSNVMNLGTSLIGIGATTSTIKKSFMGVRKEVKTLKSGIADVKREVQGFGESISGIGSIKELYNAGELKSLLSSLKGLLSSIIKPLITFAAVIGAITVALGRMAISSAATGDAIKDDAQKVYLSTTAYQEWGYVLQQNGVQISSLKMGMKQFSKEVASGGSKLEKYGITATNVSDAFEQAVFTIQNMGTETQKIAALTDLFGTRAAELMPVLNMSNAETKSLMETYRAIGGTMSNELIAKSDILTDSITEMKSAFKGLGNTIGGLVMPYITKLVQGITMLVAKITIVLKAVFGIQETFGNAEESSGGIGDNLDSATASAKKLRTLISGFDELNVLSSNNSTTDTGIDVGEYEDFKSSIMSSDMLKELDEFKKRVEENIDKIKLLGAALGAIGGGIAISKLLGNLGLLSNKLLGTIAIASILLGTFELISGAIDAFKNGLNTENLNKMLLGTTLLIGGMAAMFGVVAGAITAVVAGIALFVVGIIDFAKTGKLSKESCIAICTGLGLVVAALAVLVGGWIPLVVAAIGALVVVIIKYKDEILATLSKAWEWVKEKWNGMVGWFKTGWNSITTFFSSGWQSFSSSIKSTLETVKAWVKDKILVIFTAGYWQTKWNNLKTWTSNGIRNVVNTVIEKIERMVNNIANKFNNTGLLRGINKILGTSITLPTISIPRLAKGGVLTAPTIAMMGEYAGAQTNPEIVTPQKLLEEIIVNNNGEMVSVMSQLTSQLIAAINNKDLEVSIGDDVIARSAQRGNNNYKMRTGKTMFA